MQTNQVISPANMLSAAKQPGRQADNDNAGAFDQALSREVAERSSTAPASQAEAASPSPAAAKQPDAKGGDKISKSEKTAEDGEDSEDRAAPEAAQQFSVDLLALVAAINSITGQNGDKAGAKRTPGETGLGLDLADAGKGGAYRAPLQDLGEAAAGDAGKTSAAGSSTDPAALATPVMQDAAGVAKRTAEGTEAGTEFLDAMQDSAARLAANAPVMSPAALQAARQAQPGAADKLLPAVGTPAWDQALGQKVVWMVAGEQQSASLTLNPPDLGPLQVVLSVSNSQATATFSAAQPEVRQALEAALPKLRDMLGEAGIQLGQASVNSGAPNQNGNAGHQGGRAHGSGGDGNGNNGTGADAQIRVTAAGTASGGLGLVDTFA